jgi:hypothetical protein
LYTREFAFYVRSFFFLIACVRACLLAFLISDGNNVIKITFFSGLSLFFCYYLDQERIHSLDSSSKIIENVRYPIKPRTMAQAQIPKEESFVDISSDADVTLVPKCKNSNKRIQI